MDLDTGDTDEDDAPIHGRYPDELRLHGQGEHLQAGGAQGGQLDGNAADYCCLCVCCGQVGLDTTISDETGARVHVGESEGVNHVPRTIHSSICQIYYCWCKVVSLGRC